MSEQAPQQQQSSPTEQVESVVSATVASSASPTDIDNNPSSNSNVSVDPAFVQILEGDSLKQAIVQTTELILTPEYVGTDPALVAQIDADGYLSLEAIAQSKALRSFGLTTLSESPLELVKQALQDSPSLQFSPDGSSVRPLATKLTATQTTVILRNIPSNAEEKAVLNLFSAEDLPTPSSVRSDIGDCWFISFDKEEDARSALRFVRTQKWEGKAKIGARLKSENIATRVQHSRQSTPGAMNPNVAPFFIPQGFPGAPMFAGAPGVWPLAPSVYPGLNAEYTPWQQPDDVPSRTGVQQHDSGKRHSQHGQQQHGGRRTGGRSDRRKPTGQNSRGSSSNSQKSKSGSSSATASASSSVGAGKRQPRNTRKRTGSSSRSALNIGSVAHFPPLSNQEKRNTGYTGEFLKWDKDQIVAIVSVMKEVQRPSSLPTDCSAVLETTNTTLESDGPFPELPVETVAKTPSSPSTSYSKKARSGAAVAAAAAAATAAAAAVTQQQREKTQRPASQPQPQPQQPSQANPQTSQQQARRGRQTRSTSSSKAPAVKTPPAAAGNKAALSKPRNVSGDSSTPVVPPRTSKPQSPKTQPSKTAAAPTSSVSPTSHSGKSDPLPSATDTTESSNSIGAGAGFSWAQIAKKPQPTASTATTKASAPTELSPDASSSQTN